MRANYVPRVNTRPLIECATCGTEFQPVRDHQKYCSTLCTRAAVEERRDRKKAQRCA